MGESIYKLTGIVVVLLFLFIMLFSKLDKNKIYVSYILICFPLVSLKLVNMLDCFEIISLLFILFFYKNKLSVFADSKLYSILVYLLVLSITFGFILCDLGPGKDTIDDFIGIFPIFIFTKVFLEECIHDSHFYFKIIKFIKISLFISFVFLFFQMILGVKFSLNENIRPNVIINGAIRYTSYFTDPQHFAQYLAIAGFVCFIPSENISKIKFNNYILIIFSVLAIMTTGTRSGLFGFILGIILILLFSKPSFIFSVIIAILLFYIIVINLQDYFSLFKRSTDLNDTYDFRYSLWVEAFNMFKESPFIGIGMGNYSRYVMLHNPNQFWEINHEWLPFDVPESGYLKILSELGSIGFLIIFILILFPLIKSFFLFLKTRDFSLIYLIAALVSWLFSFNGTYTFSDTRIIIILSSVLCLLIVKINLYYLEKSNIKDYLINEN